MRSIYSAAVFLSAALCIWLFSNEKAAQPGPLSVFHQEIDRCEICHMPWRGVSERRCLQCHEFADTSLLRPEIRFHEAKKYCLECHMEHRSVEGMISGADHTLFSGELYCTQCHVDIHSGLFGGDCRECHGITTWDVPGFHHPPEDKKNCNRCHEAPYSHCDKSFWKKIEMTHGETMKPVPRKDCWRCHTTRNWRHLLMPHAMQGDQE